MVLPQVSRTLVLGFLLVGACAGPALRSDPPPPEQSVRPNVNSRFLDPALDVEEFVLTFEGESREIARSRAAIVAALELKAGERIADVGAGTGLFLQPFSAAVGSQGRLHALEISPKFVEHLNARIQAEGLTNAHARLSSERSIELPAACVDKVFICDTYHHFEYPATTLASIGTALSAGGRLFVLDFERIEGVSRPWVLDHVRIGKEDTRREIEQAGFRFEREIPVDGLKENYLLSFVRP